MAQSDNRRRRGKVEVEEFADLLVIAIPDKAAYAGIDYYGEEEQPGIREERFKHDLTLFIFLRAVLAWKGYRHCLWIMIQPVSGSPSSDK